jgi:hypothetical protein
MFIKNKAMNKMINYFISANENKVFMLMTWLLIISGIITTIQWSLFGIPLVAFGLHLALKSLIKNLK